MKKTKHIPSFCHSADEQLDWVPGHGVGRKLCEKHLADRMPIHPAVKSVLVAIVAVDKDYPVIKRTRKNNAS